MTCPSTQVYHSQAFVREVFAWTALGILIFIARFAVRLRILPWRKLQGDDYMATVTLILFMLCIATKMLVYYRAPISDYTEDEIANLLDCQISRLKISSKIQILLWYFYASFLWGLKAMVLFFFNRLPLRPYQRRLHQACAVISGLAYVAVMLTISLICLPFDLSWKATPYPPPRCAVRTPLFYTISLSNAATDVAILTVALPLLWQLRTSLQRRIELTLLLCSGIFVTTACLVTFFMSMKNPDSSLNINLWGTREEIAGIVAVNAPIIRPVFRPSFWKRDFDPSRRARLPPARPRIAVERLQGMTDRTVIDISSTPTFAAMLGRKLGILSSLRSVSSSPSTRSKAQMSGPSVRTRSTGVSQRMEEDDFKDLEWAWAVPGVVAESSPSLPRGPRPLLPDPTPSSSSQGTVQQLGGLQCISEEEESIGVLRGGITLTSDSIVNAGDGGAVKSIAGHDGA